MKITNIYYIVDSSVKTRGETANRIKQNITKVARALKFCPHKTKLHIIGYNDKAFFVHPFNAYLPHGNPDFGEGLKMLENVMNYGNKYTTAKTRSVFIWHTADNVLEGWQTPLERLFHKKEFAFGLRYVVYYGNPDKYTKQAHYRFAEAPDKILRHFSEGRLCSLVPVCHKCQRYGVYPNPNTKRERNTCLAIHRWKYRKNTCSISIKTATLSQRA